MTDLKDLLIQQEATEQAESKSRLEAILARISAEVTKHAEQNRKPPVPSN